MADSKDKRKAPTLPLRNSGLLGKAARALTGRAKQLADAEAAANGELFDRQSTDSNNN